jgi:hypothetical protein
LRRISGQGRDRYITKISEAITSETPALPVFHTSRVCCQLFSQLESREDQKQTAQLQLSTRSAESLVHLRVRRSKRCQKNGSFCPATSGASANHSFDINVETQDSISCSTSRYPPNNAFLAFAVANPIFNSLLYGLILEIALITLRIDVHESNAMATTSSDISDHLLFCRMTTTIRSGGAVPSTKTLHIVELWTKGRCFSRD